MDSLACAEATCLWLTRKFTNCQATLQKLESEGKSDLKLAHNLLVVEHAIASSAEADRIASQLDLISNDRLSGDDGNGVAAAGTGELGSGVAAATGRSRSSSNLEPLPLVPVRDDLAVAQLNRATLLFHQHRYASAAALLEPLAANVEALAEGTAVRVLTLLLDIYIEGRQLPRAVALLHRFERLYGTLVEGYSAVEKAGRQQQQQKPENGGSSGNWSAGGAGGTGTAAGEGGSSSCGGSSNGGVRPRTLALPRVSRWCTGAMERSKELLDATDRPLAAPDLKLLIKLYRSRLHGLAHNTRAAKRELKAVISALQHQQQQQQSPGIGISVTRDQSGAPEQGAHSGAQDQLPMQPQFHSHSQSQAHPAGQQHQQVGAFLAVSPSAEALLLAVRAQLELYRGRARKATKLLLAMLQDPAFCEAHRPLLLNNLGLVHHQQGKHTLALLYLSQALAVGDACGSGASAAAAQSGPGSGSGESEQCQRPQQPCAAVGAMAAAAVPVPAVMYNAGLQHLMLQNYEAARKCFAAAASHYRNTPLLWLRTAEAALGLYRRHQQHQEHRRRQLLLLEGAGAVLAAGAGGMNPLVEGVVLGASGLLGPNDGSSCGASTSAATTMAALHLPQHPRRLVLPTGAAPSPSEAGPAAAELLSEAVVALLTALQQLDAQQEAHEQWQSSSTKLEEGLSYAPPASSTTVATTTGAAATNSSVGNGSSAGGGGSDGGAQPGLAAATSGGSTAVVMPGPAEPYLPLAPQQLQQVSLTDQEQQQGAQDRNPQGSTGQSNGGGGDGSNGEDARRSGSQLQMGNGVHEPQGTDASAALSEELCAVRRAVLANLAYAHLQAEDWCAALQSAKALLAVSAPPPSLIAAGGSVAGAGSPAAAAVVAEYAFLAHNYAAEALCHLDRPGDAVEYLSLWLMTAQEREAQAQTQTQTQAQPPARSSSSQKSDEDGAAGTAGTSAGSGAREDGEQYQLGNAAALAALSGPAALAATATNLGAVFASQGELEQATALVRQSLALQPTSRSAALLLVYCELAAGNTPVALALLKQHGRPVPR
ncbi:hypothetical protein VaNZ11_012554 [Volvox africanus]|uniref:CCR4-NOT transcription complex subunit 10 n=1 Tax=Volvox africanus TaxID=51714 RepID=A0ABQ5SF87_9CHLO|nr:hypothetical protein VaNZ11_012554 [Volvox africanus]